jgi:hypothetical protein
MLITFGNQELGDDSRDAAISGLQIGGQPIIEVVAFPRALDVKTFDRGNRAATVTFTVSKRLRTVSERELFAAFHISQLANKAQLKIQSTGGFTGSGIIYLHQAALAALPRFHGAYGIAVSIDYSFVGAKLEFFAET